MKKMIKLFICFIFCFSSNVFAQRVVRQVNNVEALENINLSLERIENAITSLTSQSEENAYNQKQAKAEQGVVLKDIKLQIQEVKDEQEKFSKDVYASKIEIENLKNIVAMLQEKISVLERQKVEEKKEPVMEEKATKNPTDLLLVGSAKSDEKPMKISDDESFKLAMENFDKKDFTESAINFAANIKNFPDGKNFHKNLLYLGLSMKNLENKNGACTAFAKIVNSSENIEKEIKDMAVKEFDLLKCNPEKDKTIEEKENNANKKR